MVEIDGTSVTIKRDTKSGTRNGQITRAMREKDTFEMITHHVQAHSDRRCQEADHQVQYHHHARWTGSTPARKGGYQERRHHHDSRDGFHEHPDDEEDHITNIRRTTGSFEKPRSSSTFGPGLLDGQRPGKDRRRGDNEHDGGC